MLKTRNTSQKIKELIYANGWRDVPEIVISREGLNVYTNSEIWHLPITARENSDINFEKISNLYLRWATKRFIQEKVETTSSHSGHAHFNDIHREVTRYQSDFEIDEDLSDTNLVEGCIKLFESALSNARAEHKLWAMYRPIQWYVWCAENYPEMGFSPEYAMELSSISIPGNPKGEAVRSEDKDAGPFNRTLELPLIVKALKDDKSKEFEHIQQRAAVALSLALGRNPANLTFLKERDLVNLMPDDKPMWIIKMPRIKKRLLSPRDELLDEYLDETYANILLELIDANKLVSTDINLDSKKLIIEKPMFINLSKNKSAIKSLSFDSVFNFTSEGISRLLQDFVKRHQIISPVTDELLRVSARRFRYTLGTALAAEGISKRELARILDHTDTQHVLVYFELAGTIVEHLDSALAKRFSKMLDLFKGKIVDNESDAENGSVEDKQLFYIDENINAKAVDIGVCGNKSICHLDPPYSCYLCEKFQPYKHADHQHVLDCLINGREQRLQKYEQSRLGIQLDEVIFAVAQVVELCNPENKK